MDRPSSPSAARPKKSSYCDRIGDRLLIAQRHAGCSLFCTYTHLCCMHSNAAVFIYVGRARFFWRARQCGIQRFVWFDGVHQFRVRADHRECLHWPAHRSSAARAHCESHAECWWWSVWTFFSKTFLAQQFVSCVTRCVWSKCDRIDYNQLVITDTDNRYW